MAGRLGGGQSLVIGLAFAVAGIAAVSSLSIAEPLPLGTKISQGASPALLTPKQKHLKAEKVRSSESTCSFPWTYSRGLRRCVCVHDGYSLQGGKCVPDETGPVTAVATPDSDPSPASSSEHLSERAKAISWIQRCFAQLGYYKGPIDGKANADTWTAHWFFKNDHGLKAYGDFLAKPVQKKLHELCKDDQTSTPENSAEQVSPPGASAEQVSPPEASAEQVSAPEKPTPQPQASDVTAALETKGEAAEAPAPPPEEEPGPLIPLTHLDIDCLPEDLIDQLRHAQGDGVRAKACAPACLPSPPGLGQTQLDEMQNQSGVVWCRDCVEIEGHLSLDDVQRIERAGHFQLCAMPPRRLPRPAGETGNVVKSFMRIRELYRALPPTPGDAAAIAVIIGNGDYEKLPPAETARNDAGAMYFFLTEHLGYRQDNIIDVRNAKKADLERLFGPVPGSDGELARLVRAQPGANVLVYYAGYGATNADHNETYLLPVDAEPYREERGGYPLSTLYANLAALKAKSVLLLLESEFGRDHGPYVLPPNLPETTNSVLPRTPIPGLTVLAASDRGQRTLIDTSYDIGLFTRYLIEGLAGSADLYPVGNGDGVLDSTEIYVYTAAMVRRAARKTYGLLQQPVYSSATTTALTSAGTVIAKPN
jgi:hypothetical protein